MTEHEIKRIRNRFIMTSTLTLFCVMLIMGGFIYLFGTITIRNEAQQIMRYIAENDGDLPKPDAIQNNDEESQGSDTDSGDEHDNSFTETMEWSLYSIFGVGDFFDETPDSYYTTRYFAVLFDENETVSVIKTSHIAYIDEEQAEEYARIALDRPFRFGNFGRYYYYCADRESGGTIVVYLDRTEQLSLMRRVLISVLSILGFGTFLSFFIMRLLSKGFVRTEMENVEKQKQFITNASHELKTPLAVIKANTEMQEMMDGESEWSQSTLRQVDRMTGLIGNLVQIARAQEMTDGELAPTDIAAAVSETADSFAPVAASDGKKLEKEIPDSLVIKSSDSSMRQLTSLLVDNAIKYCDDGGTIKVELARSRRGAVLTVSNDYAEGANVDYTRFFERFYRQDEAHTISAGTVTGSSEGSSGERTGKRGYGIGQSLAESLVKSLKGRMDVS
ncbi:MAG: HAMP domain-containing histidine kinase [Lachnospiraceae bacterium]|nr:HAMP domain-containing histidine kinase [Lachnospiraceae bacterium]